MKFTALLTALVLSTLPHATLSQYTNRSHPFNLVVSSSNTTLNNTRLTACHVGAAIESFCTYPADASSPAQKFYYNYTIENNPRTGLLTWNLVANGGALTVSEPLSFSYNPASNLALALLTPGTQGQVISFDKENYLQVASYLDDSVVPPAQGLKFLGKWVMCQTQYSGYSYTMLSFVLGGGKPTNPTCQSVRIRRKAIP